MKGKRILAILGTVILFSSLMVSCKVNKEISFDITEGDMENGNGNVEIKSVELNLGVNGRFVPTYFEGNEVYGLQNLWKAKENSERIEEYPVEGGFKKNFYKVSEEGVLTETEKVPVRYNGLPSQEEYTDSKWNVGINDIFYVNNKTGEERKIGEGLYDRYDNGNIKNTTTHALIEGNEDFAYIQSFEYGTEMKTIAGEGNGTVGYYETTFKKLQIINLKENKTYTYKGDNKTVFNSFFYSKMTNSFYAFDSINGEIYEMTLALDEVSLKKYDTIKTGLKSYEGRLVTLNENGELIIFGLAKDSENIAIIYNLKNKSVREVKKGNSRLGVMRYYRDANKLILFKYDEEGESINPERYIGEFNKDGEVQIISKIEVSAKDGEDSIMDYSIISDDGEKMILVENIFDNKDEVIKKNIAHFISFK